MQDDNQKSQIEGMLAYTDAELEGKEVTEETSTESNDPKRSEEDERPPEGTERKTEKDESGSVGSTDESEGSPEGAGELSETERLRQQVNSMAKKLSEQGIGIEAPAGSVQPDTGESEDDKGKEPEAKAISFLTEEELDDLQENPARMNEVLNRVYNQARQDALKSIPDVVRKTTDRQLAIKDKVKNFYTSNPDLENNRDFVSYVASEIEAENPDKDLDWIFNKTAEEARSRLGIRKQATESEDERRNNDNNQPAFATKPRGERRAQDNRTEQQKQIDKVISL